MNIATSSYALTFVPLVPLCHDDQRHSHSLVMIEIRTSGFTVESEEVIVEVVGMRTDAELLPGALTLTVVIAALS